MLSTEVEKNIHVRISQVVDYIDTVVDVIEDAGLIPNFKNKVVATFQKRINSIYNLNGSCVMEMYNL